VVFFVVYPNSKIVFASAIKSAHKPFLYHALGVALGGTVHECDLTGKDIDGMAEILLHKESQGPYRSFRTSAQNHTNPLRQSSSVFRSGKRLSAPLVREAERQKRQKSLDDSLAGIPEDAEQERERLRQSALTFGTGPLPALDTLEIKVANDPLKCGDLDHDKIVGQFSFAKYSFDGPNLGEGLRDLVKYGMASPKLPDCLSQLSSLGKNRFTLTPEGLQPSRETPEKS